MLSPSQLQKLTGFIIQKVKLSSLSQWKVGRISASLFEPTHYNELTSILRICSEENIPTLIIGNGTNLLFDDKGVSALIIKLGPKLSSIKHDGNSIQADSGIWVPKFSRTCAQLGYTGTEHTIGIPGTLGGLVCMNGGSKQQSISDYLVSVSCIDKSGNKEIFLKKDCGFAYRSSIFQNYKWIITSICFNFPCTNYMQARREMLYTLQSRRIKFPLKLPNCGSVFVSNPIMYEKLGPPGAIIESLNFKGMRIGDAQVSPEHANFIVNLGEATTQDILDLINKIYSSVYKEYNYKLKSEVRYVKPTGEITSPIFNDGE